MFGQKKAPRDDSELTPKTRKKIRCSVCKRVINDEKCFRCCVCPQYWTCVECYSDGLVTDKHEVKHQNVVIDPEPLAGLTDDWNSNEEILLLSAIQKFGIGNWHIISEYIGTKSNIQCETHYFGTYIDCPTAPFPDQLIQEAIPIPPPPSYSIKDKKFKSYPSDRTPKNRIKPNEYSTPAEFCGWMPFRHEFEIEYHHEAEELVSHIDFTQNCDTMEQFLTNINNLRVYNAQLSERIRRTKLIEEWDIHKLENDPNHSGEVDTRFLGGESSTEVKIDLMMLPLAQYFPKDRVTAVARALHNIDAIKSTLDKRIEWINHGICSPEDGELFDQLLGLIRNNSIPPENIEKWNNLIIDHNKIIMDSIPVTDDYLDQNEKNLCKENSIDIALFISLKELFLREILAGGPLSVESAMQISNQPESIVAPIIHYIEHNGWNCN